MRRPADRSPFRQSYGLVPWLSLVMVLLWPSVAHSVGRGKWTPKFDWASTASSDRRTAIHMMLLRGDTAAPAYHSRIMWFGGEPHEVFKGGIWGWKPTTDSCVGFPTTNFTAITPPTVGYNVFCSGHSGLADGRMHVAGGHSDETGAFGVNHSTIYTNGTGTGGGSWGTLTQMAERRWYPTNTTLKDGRVLVTAGYQHRQHRLFGGRFDGNAPAGDAGDTLRRWAPVEGGAWDTPVLPEEDPSSTPGKPAPREGHTGVDLTSFSGFDNQMLIFGGKDEFGSALLDLWALKREDNITGPDYLYKWERKSPIGTGPSARSEHSAIVTRDGVVVFGGRETDGTPRNNAFLYRPSLNRWDPITIVAGAANAPSPRMGHSAIYNEMAIREGIPGVDKYVKRMIVYGGVAAEGDTPTDRTVYELRFSDSSPTLGEWLVLPETTFSYAGKLNGQAFNNPPGPRLWHRAVSGKDSVLLAGSGATPYADLAHVFGGARGGGNYSDSLWVMCLFASGRVGWVWREMAVTPGARARFSMAFDPSQGETNGPRIYVHGGNGTSDKGIWITDPYFWGDDRWYKWGEAGYTASGHVSVCESKERHSRIGEIFDPGNNSWTTLTGASSRLLQKSYPITFTVRGGSSAGGRVVTASSWDDIARYADLPGPGASTTSWHAFSGGALGFTTVAGVMYRPDKLMVAGGSGGEQVVVGTTKTLDASSTSSSWVTSGSMRPRYYHNLVLLPDGKVLATGGTAKLASFNSYPVKEPQIWDPNSGAGTWTSVGSLDSSTAIRGYHSTAILLPDGRVLCAGGWQDGGQQYHEDQLRADIYCPPYLFKADGSFADRPVVSGAPVRMIPGDPGSYTLCVSDPANVRGSSLIRPGMTTHGFDQNQRYVPLTPTEATSPSRILIPPPGTATDAPPGDYLLFVTGSSDGTDVPSLAKWVTVGGTVPGDSCDVTAPATVLDLSKAICHEGIDNQYLLTWTAPADDGSHAPSRRASIYDIRQSGAPITDANWHLAEPVGGPNPGDPGTTESMVLTVTDLIYIRMKSRDNRNGQGNWSGLSNQISLNPVLCGEGGLWGGGGGGGGGGSSLRQAAGTSSTRGGGASVTQAMENSLLNGVSAGTKERDHLRLGALEVSTDGDVMVRVRDTENHGAELDAVQLLAVDHAPNVTPYVLNGSVVLGTRQVAARVTAGDGTDVSSSLDGVGAYTLDSGEALDVDLGPGGGASPFVVEAQGPGALDVLVPDGVGGWQVASRGHPRAAMDELVFAAPGADWVRLVSTGIADVRFVGKLALSPESPSIRAAALVSGTQSGIGDVSTTLTAGDSATTTLVGPDTLSLVFRPAPMVEGAARDYFLVVEGKPLDPGAAMPLRRERVPSPLPPRFALREVQPNPFVKSTNIRFELPVGAIVRLEVFDAQGRRIATLANRYYPPGFHTASWSPSESGASVGPGVYFCRLEAGHYRARTRMVLLP